ncbi:MAG: PEP-CTERM sorting domain-containing protein [bacterium]|nr:PEP-CTERM sorting domain-containing protein [bacterium]
MTFEHDLRVYEISLDPPVATPEPGTLLLLGAGLLGLFAWKRTRS